MIIKLIVQKLKFEENQNEILVNAYYNIDNLKKMCFKKNNLKLNIKQILTACLS